MSSIGGSGGAVIQGIPMPLPKLVRDGWRRYRSAARHTEMPPIEHMHTAYVSGFITGLITLGVSPTFAQAVYEDVLRDDAEAP